MKIKTITDEEILDLILAGRITAKRINSRNPVICKDSKELSASIVPGKSNPRYRIEICLPKKSNRHRKKRKRTIVRAKIVWMIKHRRVVSEAHELHHLDEDRLNDAAKNIVDWTEEQHRNYHNGHNEVPF